MNRKGESMCYTLNYKLIQTFLPRIWVLFLFKFYFILMGILPTHMCTPWQVPMETRKEWRIPWDWSYQGLWVYMRALGTEPGSPDWVHLNLWTIYLSIQHNSFYFFWGTVFCSPRWLQTCWSWTLDLPTFISWRGIYHHTRLYHSEAVSDSTA